MKSYKIRLSKKQVLALIVANLFVLIPFVGWMAIAPLLPPDYLMSVPRTLSVGWFMKGMLWGLICCLVGTLFIGWPALYRLEERHATHVGAYFREILLWVVIYSLIIGALSAGLSMSLTAFLMPAGICAAFLALPSVLAGLIYWHLAVRESRDYWVLVFMVVLFLLWNLMAVNIAAFVGTD